MSSWLDPLRVALERSRGNGRGPVPLFVRDDDAGWDDERLFALCDLFAARSAPLDLAVIPTELDETLARQLRARARAGQLAVHQHGFAHRNHEVTGRKCEFGPSRPVELQRADIARGRARLDELLGELVQPFFTPPWNRCTAGTAEVLRDLGFELLSRESRAERFGVDGLPELPVHVDWMAHRKGVRVGLGELGARLAAAVEEGGPVGLMLHHAAMDGADLAAVGELLDLLGDLSDRVVLRPMSDCARDSARATLRSR
jgi:hypothetical protein